MMGLLILVTVVYVEVVKVETKFVIRRKDTCEYFLSMGNGVTSEKADAHRYTRETIKDNPCFNKKLHVLIPVTK